MLIRQWFSSTLFVVGGFALCLAGCMLFKSCEVSPLDIWDGVPPDEQARHITGPTLDDAVRAMGDTSENAIGDDY